MRGTQGCRKFWGMLTPFLSGENKKMPGIFCSALPFFVSSEVLFSNALGAASRRLFNEENPSKDNYEGFESDDSDSWEEAA